MSTALFTNTVGYLFIYERPIEKPFQRTNKYALSEDKIKELKSKPLEYKITPNPVPEKQVFTWDGKQVDIDIVKFGRFLTHLSYDQFMKLYNNLKEVLNNEQLYSCPYCGTVDSVSALASDVVHHKSQCGIGHYDRFFWDHSSFTPRTFTMLSSKTKEWEKKCINNLYNTIHDKQTSSSCNGVGFFIQDYSRLIKQDLGVKRFYEYKNKYFS